MKKVSKLLTILLALVLLLPGLINVAEATGGERTSGVVNRIEGIDRIETAIKVSKEVYPAGSTENAVIAGWDGQVDALTATILASTKDAPLLLATDGQYSTVKDELNRLGIKNVYIAGGTSVVSAEFEKKLKEDKYGVTRLSGEDRYATAAEVMKEAGVNLEHAFIVNGGVEKVDRLADALAVGPVSGRNKSPILLTLKDQLPHATMNALKGVQQITIVGGHAAVSEKVERELKDKGYQVERVQGEDRYETAVEVSKKYFEKSSKSILVNDGRVSFADALVGGYLGVKKDAPILLTNANQLTDHTRVYIEKNISSTYVLGGAKSIGQSVFDRIDEIIRPIIKRSVESIEPFVDVAVEFTGAYQLPARAEIVLSDQEVVTVPVEWSDKHVDVTTSGVYKVEGHLDLSAIKDLLEEAKNKKATINIVVAEKIEVDDEIVKDPFRVIVDYGHGGSDPGAIYNGRLEKNDTLKLGRLITAELRRQGIVVDETRIADEYVGLDARSNFANRNGREYYDYFISIHRNAFHPNVATGSETFVYTTGDLLSTELAKTIQKGLTNIGFRNRGVKQGNFHVLRETLAPSVLVEVGFMDNDWDNTLFDQNLEKIAKSIADAVMLQVK